MARQICQVIAEHYQMVVWSVPVIFVNSGNVFHNISIICISWKNIFMFIFFFLNKLRKLFTWIIWLYSCPSLYLKWFVVLSLLQWELHDTHSFVCWTLTGSPNVCLKPVKISRIPTFKWICSTLVYKTQYKPGIYRTKDGLHKLTLRSCQSFNDYYPPSSCVT